MPRLQAIDPKSANAEAKVLLDTVQSKIGMTPNVLRTLANAPAALQGYLDFGEALSSGSFDAKTREAIALTVAGANACGYCASAHTALSKSLKVEDEEIAARLSGHSADPSLKAILAFTRKIVDKRGLVDDDGMSVVRAAGHDDATIVEIIANVTANTSTNYVNHVAETEIDFPKAELPEQRAA